MKNWYRIRAARQSAEILLYEEIGGWGKTSKDFMTELSALGDLKTISVRIHSVGGDVYDAYAIHNALVRHPAAITVHIDGLCASAATFVALAGDTIFMAENALFMIHEPWSFSGGNADALQKEVDLLNVIAEQMTALYARKTGTDPDTLRDWMRAETWFTAEQALAAGFIDAITTPMKIAATAYDLSRFTNAPRSVLMNTFPPYVAAAAPAAVAAEPVVAPALPIAPADHAVLAVDNKTIVNLCNQANEPALIETMIDNHLTHAQVTAKIANAQAVRLICARAGLPELASGLIAAGVTEQHAMLVTWRAMADRSDQNPVDSTPPPPDTQHMPRAQFMTMAPQRQRDFIRAGGRVV